MKKSISSLGKTLSKTEQSNINGGRGIRYCSTRRDCMGPWDGPGDWSCRRYIGSLGICVPN
ncbi:hypothetical protein ABW636_18490 [Aquimarina sp. 2201CG1-2-11]|uniref:hypothetical protein n=1 Tax=Aquimarina discodermiae TaxID=3231043 RepID=UPI0034623AC1